MEKIYCLFDRWTSVVDILRHLSLVYQKCDSMSLIIYCLNRIAFSNFCHDAVSHTVLLQHAGSLSFQEKQQLLHVGSNTNTEKGNLTHAELPQAARSVQNLLYPLSINPISWKRPLLIRIEIFFEGYEWSLIVKFCISDTGGPVIFCI